MRGVDRWVTLLLWGVCRNNCGEGGRVLVLGASSHVGCAGDPENTVRCGNTEEGRTTLPERSRQEAVRSEAGATSATRKVERCVRALPGPCCTEEERLGRGPERRGEQV